MDGGDDDLVERQAGLERTQHDLAELADQAIADNWPHDERDALADARDNVADEVDDVAISFDGRAQRLDENAITRQVLTRSRQDHDLGTQSGSDAAVYGRYMAERDREGTAADREGAAADRVRSATRRQTAKDARDRSAADRDEAAADRATFEGVSGGDTADPED